MFKRVVCLILTALFLTVPALAADGEEPLTVLEEEHFLDMGSVEKYTEGLGITAEQYEQLKTLVYGATRNCESACDISAFSIKYTATTHQYLNDFVTKGDPESFHVAALGGSITTIGGIRYFRTLSFTYQYEGQTYETMKAEMIAVADELLEGVEGNDALDDVKKALILHDRLAVWCEYDKANLDAGTVPYDSYNMYGALVNRICVCEGYTKAYSYLLDRVGIENYYCDSRQLGHIWNIVKINGEKYHVDVTWDDPTYDVTGYVQHDYFLCSTDKMMNNGHTTSDYDTTPASTLYDDAFWGASNTSFVLFGNDIYYIDNVSKTFNLWSGDNMTVKRNLAGRWLGEGNIVFALSFSCLTTDGEYVYYSLPREVVRYDTVSNTTSTLYTYTTDSTNRYFYIYGIKTEENVLTVDVNDYPLFDATTKENYEFTVDYELPDLPGDVNDDGKINVKDLQAIKKFMAGNTADISFVFHNADVFVDGKVTVKDCSSLKKLMVGGTV